MRVTLPECSTEEKDAISRYRDTCIGVAGAVWRHGCAFAHTAGANDKTDGRNTWQVSVDVVLKFVIIVAQRASLDETTLVLAMVLLERAIARGFRLLENTWQGSFLAAVVVALKAHGARNPLPPRPTCMASAPRISSPLPTPPCASARAKPPAFPAEDESVHTIDVARALCMPKVDKHLHKLEMALLKTIDFEVHVEPSTFTCYRDDLRTLSEGPCGPVGCLPGAP